MQLSVDLLQVAAGAIQRQVPVDAHLDGAEGADFVQSLSQGYLSLASDLLAELHYFS